MSPSLYNRILQYAVTNRHRLIWKQRLYALLYGASLPVLNRIKKSDAGPEDRR